jgi:hypothetical protein
MAPGENMPADQAAAAMGGAMAPPTGPQPIPVTDPGVAKSIPPTIGAAVDMGLSSAPGFTYFHHLLGQKVLGKGEGEMAKPKEPAKPGIYTDQAEACKTAIGMLGLYSDKNPAGLPIPLQAAKELFFKGNDPHQRDYADWRNRVDRGDRALDPKHIRKFVNYDGSLTYEILNHDKTVQARFTMGSMGEKVIFASGGYSSFKETMEKYQQEHGESDGFDAVRAAMAGGNDD